MWGACHHANMHASCAPCMVSISRTCMPIGSQVYLEFDIVLHATYQIRLQSTFVTYLNHTIRKCRQQHDATTRAHVTSSFLRSGHNNTLLEINKRGSMIEEYYSSGYGYRILGKKIIYLFNYYVLQKLSNGQLPHSYMAIAFAFSINKPPISFHSPPRNTQRRLRLGTTEESSGTRHHH